MHWLTSSLLCARRCSSANTSKRPTHQLSGAATSGRAASGTPHTCKGWVLARQPVGAYATHQVAQFAPGRQGDPSVSVCLAPWAHLRCIIVAPNREAIRSTHVRRYALPGRVAVCGGNCRQANSATDSGRATSHAGVASATHPAAGCSQYVPNTQHRHPCRVCRPCRRNHHHPHVSRSAAAGPSVRQPSRRMHP